MDTEKLDKDEVQYGLSIEEFPQVIYENSLILLVLEHIQSLRAVRSLSTQHNKTGQKKVSANEKA